MAAADSSTISVPPELLEAIAFDVDGVLTDGTLTWSPSGEESKSFSFTDIMGVSLLRRLGIKMALISGEPSPLVDLYAKKMHIPFVAKGTRDKATALRDFTAQFHIPLHRTCFFGDDVNDLFAMEIAASALALPTPPPMCSLTSPSTASSRSTLVATAQSAASPMPSWLPVISAAATFFRSALPNNSGTSRYPRKR